jgi:N6-L-threonylcarbamoyladenine synthase
VNNLLILILPRLRSFLDVRGFAEVRLSFPPPEFCVDNAAMIAWTGLEMYQAGWKSDLSVRALRKWSIDPNAQDGGILGIGGWGRRNETTG